MERAVAVTLLMLLSYGAAGAASLAPLNDPRGLPFAQLLGTAQVLGEWRLLSGGNVRLIEAMSAAPRGECGVSERDDADICGRFTMFVSLNGETSIPVDFTLFRLPETLGWKIPKGATPESDYGKFNLPLSACEIRKTSQGYGWRGVSYRLSITEELKDTAGGAHYVFTADLTRQPGERQDCAP